MPTPRNEQSATAEPLSEHFSRSSMSSIGSNASNPASRSPDSTGERRKPKRRQVDAESPVDFHHPLTSEERASPGTEHPASKVRAKDVVINISLVLSWYFFSTSISVYNKWMFTEPTPDELGPAVGSSLSVTDDDLPADPATMGAHMISARGLKRVFPFPLFTTAFHMVVQFSLAFLVVYFLPQFRPGYKPPPPQPRSDQEAGLLLNRQDENEAEDEDLKQPLMTKTFYARNIAPCGAATGVDIGFGNMSMRFITLTFYTMCKSSVIGFALFFAFLFKLEEPTWRLCAIVAAMVVGVFMMAVGETEFSAPGFALVMTAACSSGLRWALTQRLLLKHPATSNPFSGVLFLSPAMFVTLVVLAACFEGFGPLSRGLSEFMGLHGLFLGVGALVFPGCLAFCMTVSEFAFLKRTSVVSLSIAGIFKEVVTFIAAYLVFGDQLTLINSIGVVITIVAILWYNMMKYGIEFSLQDGFRRKRVMNFPE